MGSLSQAILAEIADNWPAFVYIGLTIGFSVCFLKERRAETRALKLIAERLELTVYQRFDRLERVIAEKKQINESAVHIQPASPEIPHIHPHIQ